MPDFSEYLMSGKRGHLIGIGGVSMSPLAEVLSDAGLIISGSDIAESERTSHLREKGIAISIGHDAANITGDIDFVIRTAAAHDDNPEVLRARETGIPVFERTQAWGAIMRGYKNALCISGTHGKTTTTSMCTHILMAAEKDPTVMIGGTLPLLKARHGRHHSYGVVRVLQLVFILLPDRRRDTQHRGGSSRLFLGHRGYKKELPRICEPCSRRRLCRR